MKQIDNHKGHNIFLVRPGEKDAEFWALFGPVATNPEVHKTLGGPVADTDNHVWLLAVKDGHTTAISSYQVTGSTAVYNETYVTPEARGDGLYEKLFDLKYSLCAGDGAQVVKGMANGRGRGMFEKRGWTLTRETVNWAWFEKVVD